MPAYTGNVARSPLSRGPSVAAAAVSASTSVVATIIRAGMSQAGGGPGRLASSPRGIPSTARASAHAPTRPQARGAAPPPPPPTEGGRRGGGEPLQHEAGGGERQRAAGECQRP